MKNYLLLFFLVYSVAGFGQANYQAELNNLLTSLNELYRVNYGALPIAKKDARVIYSAPMKALVFFTPSGERNGNDPQAITQIQVVSISLKDLHYKSAGIKEVEGGYFVGIVSRKYLESFEMAVIDTQTRGLRAGPNFNFFGLQCKKPACHPFIQMIPAQIEALIRKFSPNISPLEEVPNPFQ
ncbi:MAG TPA: hypothetical protein VJ953_07990 [Saprospiraceae bacterium]|nr:hypothetical protein [Saprospiraceae bacterium]